MQVTGKLVFIGQTQQVSEKFKLRQFVVETTDTYPQKFQIQLNQDKCGLIDNAKLGETITADCNVRSREWISPQGEVKYFLTLEAWRIALSAPAQGISAPPSNLSTPPTSEEADDLPF